MKVVALISGGKDSCYNMMQCVSEGHEIVALANLKPKDCDELDSYMYQTVGHQAIDMYAEAMDLPLYRRTIEGSSKQVDKYYQPTASDEVEDLYELLKTVKDELKIEAVSVGAILSDYQRVRVENVCERLGLTSLAYLWRRDQDELLQEMIKCKVEAIIIKVAALGLDPNKHLGKTLSDIYPHMLKMSDKFGLNICGEGGEFESFTYDCPLFNKKIVIDEVEKVIHSYDAFAPVGYLNLKKLHLVDKNISHVPLNERLKNLALKRGCDLQTELILDKTLNTNGEEAEIVAELPPSIKCNRVLYRKEENWFYVSNLISCNSGSSSIKDQAKHITDQLKDILSSLNVTTENLVAVCLYVKRMLDFQVVNSVYKTLFSINPPIRCCVEANLPSNVDLQIDCCGIVNAQSKSTLHVQSISHWASANIGPYSQAITVDSIIYVAGQIALCPSSMCIIEGGIVPQVRLSLRHADRILAVMSADCTLNNVLMCICYVTTPVNIPVAKKYWNKEVKTINIKQYGELEVTNHTSLVQCVVVPALPRNALVEWQVYAASKICPLVEFNVTEKYSSYKISIDVICSKDDTSNVFTCKTVVDKTSTDEVNSKDMINSLFKQYDNVLIKMKLDWTSVPLLRIFFPTNLFHYDDLLKDVYNSIEMLTDSPPVFSLVPVIALESSTHLLSVCH